MAYLLSKEAKSLVRTTIFICFREERVEWLGYAANCACVLASCKSGNIHHRAPLTLHDLRRYQEGRVYSMSSATRKRSEVGSLKVTGNVIFVMSFPIIDLRMP